MEYVISYNFMTLSNYTCDFFQAGSGVCLERKKLMHYLLQGTVASKLEDFTSDEKPGSENSTNQLTAGLLLF